MNREVMQQAFDLLCDAVEPTATQIQADIGMCAQWDVDAIECIDTLRQALAQPEQEELIQFMDGKWSYVRKPWVWLTDDEIEKIVDLNTSDDGGFDIWCDGIAVAHIVCAKLKEKNT